MLPSRLRMTPRVSKNFPACTRGVAVQRTRRKEKGPQARARKTANHGEEDETERRGRLVRPQC